MHIVTRDEASTDDHPFLDTFLEIPPRHPEALNIAKKMLEGRVYPRESLALILADYNRSIGNDDSSALANAKKVGENDVYCVVTGQQLGVLGGPAYTILKAISCILLARQSRAIPIFWLATEDHDIGEIESTFVLDKLGNIKKYRLPFPKGGAVEDLILSEENISVIKKFLSDCHLEESNFQMRAGESYSLVMARFLAHIFRGTGLLFIEPRCLRPLSVSFFEREIVEAQQINTCLIQTSEKLVKAGGIPGIEVQDGDINLFYKDKKGQRKKIRRQGTDFLIGDQEYSEEKLRSLIRDQSGNFSPAAISRPLFQCSVIPTIAYIGGPAELEYHRQLKEYFHYHNIPMPWIYPRLSMTFITKEAQDFMEKLKLEPWNPLPRHWEVIFPQVQGIKDLKERKNALRALCEKNQVPYSALHVLYNLLQPYGKLQERTFNWFWLQAQTNENLIENVMQKLSWDAKGHHYCYLS